jgi:membrane associated rhomboid family serine protease
VYFLFFFPVGTDSRKIHPAFGTLFLLLAIVALYAVRYVAPPVYLELVHRSFIPASPRWTGALLSLFLHGSWMHLLGNGLYLWIFGRQLEGRLGFAPLAAIFFLGGVASCWCQAWLSSPSHAHIPVVGASGAIAALLGATLVRFRHQRVRVLYFVFAFLGGMTRGGVAHLNAVLACGIWFGLQVAWGLAAAQSGTGNVAYSAHAGGFLSGIALSFLLGMHRGAHHDVHRELGRRYFERGEWYAATGELTTHLLHVPDDREAAAMRARGWVLLGRGGEAASEYLRLFRDSRARGDFDEASRLYREMRRYGIGSNLSESGLLRLAFDLHKSGHPEEAAEVFLEVTHRFPAGPKAELALIRRAEILWNELGSCDLAEECYRDLLKSYPDSEWSELADARLRSIRALAGRAVTGTPNVPGSSYDSARRSAARGSAS